MIRFVYKVLCLLLLREAVSRASRSRHLGLHTITRTDMSCTLIELLGSTGAVYLATDVLQTCGLHPSEDLSLWYENENNRDFVASLRDKSDETDRRAVGVNPDGAEDL